MNKPQPLTQEQLDFLTSLMSLDLDVNSNNNHGYKLQHVINQMYNLNKIKLTLEDMENNPRDYEYTKILDYCIVRDTPTGVMSNIPIDTIFDTTNFNNDVVYDLKIKVVYSKEDLPKDYDEELIWTSSNDKRVITNNIEMDYYERDRVEPQDYKYGYVILVTGKIKVDIKETWEYIDLLSKYNRAKETLKVRIAEIAIQ